MKYFSILLVTIFLTANSIFAQMTDAEKSELYPEKYTFEKADSFQKKGEFEKAKNLLEQLLEKEPDSFFRQETETLLLTL